jgi:hypothetical protein
MAPPKQSRKGMNRGDVIGAITTPLGFFVLALLIIEATLAVVLTCSKLDAEHVWIGFLCMSGIFGGVILIVTALTIFNPKNLLYGKEEHREPLLEPSALKDQIEDLIATNVKPECLNPPQA